MIFKKIPKIVFVTSKTSNGNMSFTIGDYKEALQNRKKFFSSLKINLNSIIALKQRHGNKVVKVDKTHSGSGSINSDDAINADGFITNQEGIYLMVKVADCHQIAFFDPKNLAISLIHAGWKSLDKGIIKNAINLMKKNFNTNPKDLIIQFGPSIGPCCYRIDLWKQAEDQLMHLGIPKKNIDNPKICTYHTNEYFSHRRADDQNLPDYRFVTILGIKNVN